MRTDRGPRHTGRVIGTALRFLLIRVLPRRIVPLLTAIEVFRLIRRWRTRRAPTAEYPRPDPSVAP
jgi:hypothetical protein